MPPTYCCGPPSIRHRLHVASRCAARSRRRVTAVCPHAYRLAGRIGVYVFAENSVDQRACAGCVGRVREQFGMDAHSSVGVADSKDPEQCRDVGAVGAAGGFKLHGEQVLGGGAGDDEVRPVVHDRRASVGRVRQESGGLFVESGAR